MSRVTSETYEASARTWDALQHHGSSRCAIVSRGARFGELNARLETERARRNAEECTDLNFLFITNRGTLLVLGSVDQAAGVLNCPVVRDSRLKRIPERSDLLIVMLFFPRAQQPTYLRHSDSAQAAECPDVV